MKRVGPLFMVVFSDTERHIWDVTGPVPSSPPFPAEDTVCPLLMTFPFQGRKILLFSGWRMSMFLPFLKGGSMSSR